MSHRLNGLLLLGSVLCASMLLNGCAQHAAGPTAQTGAGGADLITESDEPDARKRARLRVELATGYFEQGQTTVALDEIKQALAADGGYAPAHNLRGLAPCVWRGDWQKRLPSCTLARPQGRGRPIFGLQCQQSDLEAQTF